MYLKSIELIGFKSFGKKSKLEFSTPITSIVGPNGSGKSNTAEAFRFVLGEQSMKGLRSKRREDLIWGGSMDVPRSNRASVKVVFDNTKRLLDVDFDEVELERVVYRDGTNEYMINGSKVRLKDITSLLSGANIGSSGHQIISQGEADRVISATLSERRQIIEDALGLRIYQHKKDESLKKLEKTEENKKQVEALRLESMPHLRFLERQIKKIEKAHALREELVSAYSEYLKYEEVYLSLEKETIEDLRKEPLQKLKDIEKRADEIRKILEKSEKGNKKNEEVLKLKSELSNLRKEHAGYMHEMGRIEGQIFFEKNRIEEEKRKVLKEDGKPIPYKDAKKLWDNLTYIFDKVHKDGEQVSSLVNIIKDAQKVLRKFIERYVVDEKEEYVPDIESIKYLENEKNRIESKGRDILERINSVENKINTLNKEIDNEKEGDRELERELYTIMATEGQLKVAISELVAREKKLLREEEDFKREISEGVVLIGRQIQNYKDFELPNDNLDINLTETQEREKQLERRRKLEKIKIRLEETGGVSSDEIMNEYKDAKERDDFLAKELLDLEESAKLLSKLIDDLNKELSEKFKEGLDKISSQFNNFFTLMFGGGSASLKLKKVNSSKDEDEFSVENDGNDDEIKAGVEIGVSLPKKRIKSLMMLSGGERALTSIALIFAMSQVNPPPFLILDETDAALDEANSRRYGDMIENLSKKSQLIVITHNRETMSRADVLYGITMGSDGVSRILSVKFDDAVAVAK